jgi:lipoate-protein ligase A
MVDADFTFAAPAGQMDCRSWPDTGRDPDLRLWANQRCIVASRGQSVMPHFERARADSNEAGWPVVMRRSGGTAVVHRPGILNVTWRRWLPTQSQAWLTAGYEAFLKLLIDAVGRLGLQCDHGPVAGSHCDGRFNLRHRGRKLAGTAAYSGVVAGARYCVFHASITVSGSIEEDLAAITRFEHGLGLQRTYDASAHASLSELVAAGAGWTQPGFA